MGSGLRISGVGSRRGFRISDFKCGEDAQGPQIPRLEGELRADKLGYKKLIWVGDDLRFRV